MNASSNHHELQIVLASCFGEDQRFEGLSSVIDISKIVSKRFSIDDHFSSALDHKHLSFSTFSPGPSVKLVWDLLRFLDFLEFVGGLFEREILEL